MEKLEAQPQAPHVALLPSPGIGHLIPLVEFAKRLVQENSFVVTIVIPCVGSPSKAQISVLNSLPPSIKHFFLPPVNFDDLPEDTKIETRISLTVVRSVSSLREVLKSLVATTKLVAFVTDTFGIDALDVAKELNVSPYVFQTAAAMDLSLFLYLPTLDQMVSGEYRDLQELVNIPGCIPIHGKDLFDPVQDRSNEAYRWLLHESRSCKLAEGIILNSFADLEPGAIKALQEEPGYPPVYPVGPLVKTGRSSGNGMVEGSDSECLKWLDEQPDGSVLFVSFGSGGTLSHEQLIELAFGLEMSEQRFLWVVRSPDNKAASGMYFKVHDQMEPFDYLPEGFLERTKKQGFVVASWAPQAEILSHGSTGGFLSHCGWNSTLESIVNGVPMITWPLFAEQKMNAVMLTEDVKVAMRPKAKGNGLVGREEIARVVKALMEGEEGNGLRNRMKDMKEAAAKALSENGSSTEALSEMALKWKSRVA